MAKKKAKKAAETKKPVQEPVKKTRIKVVGIGGGAGSIISELASRIKKATFAVVNTDSQALKTLRKKEVLPFQFGESLTHGLGTGMNPELAKTAAVEEKERLKKLFQGYDLCILISCLGGGVSSGAAPFLASLAKNSGLLTLGVFTLPFKFEGEKKQELAREALQKLKPYVNAMCVLPNDKIFQVIEKTTPLKEALSFVNKNLADSLEGLIETIYLPGLINIDFADCKTILQGYGKIAYLNTVEVQGEGGALEAAKLAVNSPLYPYTIKGARKVLFNITGDKDLQLADVSQVSRLVFDQVFAKAQIIFGISQSSLSRHKIKVTLLATGIPARFFSGETPEPQKKKVKRRKERKPEPKQELKSKLRKKIKPQPNPKIKPKSKPKPKPKIIKVSVTEEKTEAKVRKNALQVKEEAVEAEREFLEKEKFWETPAFLRKQRT